MFARRGLGPGYRSNERDDVLRLILWSRGCFAEGTYRPETKLYGDSAYTVVSNDEIAVQGKVGFTKYVRCPSRKGAAQQPDAPDERAPSSEPPARR